MKKLIFAIVLVVLVAASIYFINQKDTTDTINAVETSELIQMKDSIVGSWLASNDSKSVLIFRDDGVDVDIYDGEELGRGTWEVFQELQEGEDEPSVFLRRVTDGESFLYSVWSITDTELVINYLARGNTLSYKRIQEPLTKYMNTEYPFTLSYPETWEAQDALKPQELRAIHEVVIAEKEYELWRSSVAVRIFPNEKKQTVEEWWNEWLTDEDAKEAVCREENGEESPCLFLRGLVEWQEEAVLGTEEAITVGLFRFDHEEVCTYAAHGEYIYGLCAAGSNPNDPNAAENLVITNSMRDSFKFD